MPRILPLLLSLLALLLSQWAGAEETDTANRLYQINKDAIYQVRIIEKSSGNKAVIGSGFQISPDGLVASNYHVVAEAVAKPDGYEIQYLASDGTTGTMQLLAVDVLHDLALLRIKRPHTPWLHLNPADLDKGTRIYSMGNPHDLGMTVVEGTFNGLVEHSLYERDLFSGSLNPGMSGGPSINRKGEVVGINVATAGNNISFLVPVRYLIALRASLSKLPAKPDWNKLLEQQLLQNQDQYVSGLLKNHWKLERLGKVLVPAEIAPYVKCWGDKSDDKDSLYQVTNRTCHVPDSLFLGEYFSTGSFRIQYQWLDTEKLNEIQFYNQMQKFFSMDVNNQAYKDDVSPFVCESKFVNINGKNWKVHWCARRYKRFPALNDVSVTMASLASPRQGMVVTFTIAGVSRENALKLTRRFMGAIQWKS